MQYMGGKSRISNDISKIINDCVNKNKIEIFASLFCGTCAIESKVNVNNKILNDYQEYLIEMLKALQNGYELPDVLSKEEYNYVKENKDNDKALTGFVGFGCAFGGKWFGGYAKNNSGTNYCKQSKNSMMRKMETLQKENTKFLNLSYEQVEISNNSLVYCDPPYKGTTKYSNTNTFDHNKFWEYMRELSKNNIVMISELNAPNDFKSIWNKDFKRVLDVNKDNIFNSIEKLFVHESNLYRM